MQSMTVNKTGIKEQFEQLDKFSNVSPSFRASRKDAFAQFIKNGFPKRKQEEYRYLDLSWINEDEFSIAPLPDFSIISANVFAIKGLQSNRLVFIDGHFDDKQSNIIDHGAFTIGTLQDLDEETAKNYFAHSNYAQDYNPFATLNTAFATNGAYIQISKGQIVKHPIQLININTGTKWVQPFHLMVLEENAQATIIENYFSLTDQGIDNTFLRIVAKQNAILDHYKLQVLGENAKHFGTTHIEQKRHSNCSTHVYNLGGGLVRNNIHIDIEDDHTEANMYGLYVTTGNEIVDNHTLVNHMKPNCESNQLYKGVMDDHSTAIFNGKIFVQRDAQVTNAFQSNRNLLLSNEATINTKPQLEIWADDVKCSHGATIGRLNQDEIFYLRSRGIDKAKAKSMLTFAFAAEVLTFIKVPELRQFLEEGVALKLGFEM